MGELYKLDFPNGKSYIGITTKTSAKRFKGHEKDSKTRKTAVYEAWRKHGKPVLKVLAILEDKDLEEMEIKAIEVFKTQCPNGYNVSRGGNISPMLNDIAKEKISVLFKEKWKNPVFAKNISEKMKGNSNRRGQPNSNEHNERVSLALKGKKFTESHKDALKEAWIKRKEKGLGVPWNKGRTA